jgi:hypothetical protein
MTAAFRQRIKLAGRGLLYNPANPEQVELKSGVGRAFAVGGMSALGITGLACILPSLLGVIVGVYLLIRSRKPRRRRCR